MFLLFYREYFKMRRNRLGKEDWVNIKWQPGKITHTFQKDATSCGAFVMQVIQCNMLCLLIIKHFILKGNSKTRHNVMLFYHLSRWPRWQWRNFRKYHRRFTSTHQNNLFKIYEETWQKKFSKDQVLAKNMKWIYGSLPVNWTVIHLLFFQFQRMTSVPSVELRTCPQLLLMLFGWD